MGLGAVLREALIRVSKPSPYFPNNAMVILPNRYDVNYDIVSFKGPELKELVGRGQHRSTLKQAMSDFPCSHVYD